MKRHLVKGFCVAAVCVGAVLGAVLGVTTGPAFAVGNPKTLPSLLCSFTEPFITAIVSTEGLSLDDAESTPTAYQFQSADVANPKKRVYRFRTSGKEIELTVASRAGSDGMSDRTYALSGMLGGNEGGCTEFPKGYVPRKVRGVAADDVLNVRSSASAKARIVGTAPNDQWIFVSKSTAKWNKVAVLKFPANETGTIRVAKGWANSTFLTKQPAATF